MDRIFTVLLCNAFCWSIRCFCAAFCAAIIPEEWRIMEFSRQYCHIMPTTDLARMGHWGTHFGTPCGGLESQRSLLLPWGGWEELVFLPVLAVLCGAGDAEGSHAHPDTVGWTCNFAVSQGTQGVLGMATQESYGFQGVFFFTILCIYYLKDTWTASESLLPSPEGGFVIEYIDFGRVASNDPPLLLFRSPCSLPTSYFFFFSWQPPL